MQSAYAKITSTPTPTVDMTQQIQTELQARIASQVAQMHLTQKEGVIGTVVDVNNTQITINSINNKTQFIDVDELTKFNSSTSQTFGISDITKGTTIGVLGLFNKESRRILARFVTVLILPVTFNGVIAQTDRTNYVINVISNTNKEINIAVEDVTKTFSYSDGVLTKSGFSKMTTNERISVTGYYDKKNTNQIIASRIILFPQTPFNPLIDLQKFGLYNTTTVTPSTGSGVKLVPIVK